MDISLSVALLTCPKLRDDPNFAPTSEFDSDYNCISWAAGEQYKITKWWPLEHLPSGCFWPAGVPAQQTVGAFMAAFATIGYELCDHGELEAGYEKICLFAQDGLVEHASRQLSCGVWTSKLGDGIDVSHTLSSVGCDLYGQPVAFMKRAATARPCPD